MRKLFSSLFFWIAVAVVSWGGTRLVIEYWPDWGGSGLTIFLLMLLFLVSGFMLLTFVARGTTRLPGRGRSR